MFTVSGIVLTNDPALLYTVSVWVYIMFWAKTRPVFDAATDFGEMWPLIVLMIDSRRWSVGGPGASRPSGETLVRGEPCERAAAAVGVVDPLDPNNAIASPVTPMSVASPSSVRRNLTWRLSFVGARRFPVDTG